MTEEKKRIFETESMALPPLKMVLGEARSSDQPSPQTVKPLPKGAEKAAREEMVLRLIERLIAKE